MKIRYLLLAAVVAGAPLQAKPVPRAVMAAPASSVMLRQNCDQLAVVVTPDDAVPHQVDSIIGAMLQAMLQQDSGFAAMNRKYPGLTDAIAVRVRPIMINGSLSTLPLYRAELSQLYAENFTPAEAATALAFFRSADGQMLMTNASANLDYSKSSAAMAQGNQASTTDLKGDVRSAAVKTAADMSPAQRQRVARFFGSPAGRKIIAMGPRKAALDQKWFNYSPPGLQDKVAVATIEAMLDHIGKTDPEMAKSMRDALIAQGALPKA